MNEDITALLTQSKALTVQESKIDNQAMLEKLQNPPRERLRDLLAQDLARGKVDRKAIARECNISPQAISGWLATGRISKSNLVIVARHTKRPIEQYLSAADGDFDDDTGDVGDLSIGSGPAFSRAAEPSASYNVQTPQQRGARPVISWVRAGLWEDIADPFAPGQADKWEMPLYRSGQRSFWLVVDGDSMVADGAAAHSFPHGTLIHCDPDAGAEPGKYVIAKNVLSQKATFKKLTTDGMMLYLTPLNTRYPTMPIDSENIRIIATVTEWRIGGKL